MNSVKTVPVLITGDIDYSKHHSPDGKRRALDEIMRAASELNAILTFFVTANEATQLETYTAEIVREGHEIGCRGLTHGEEEEYGSMPLSMQEKYIATATSILKDAAETEITSFRAPRVKISETTHKVLEQHGYASDSSVCSQRCDLVSSNTLNVGWLFAPRRPYYPNEHNAYKRGDLDLLEIPISAIAVPFISSALYVLGLNVMKLLFRALYFESLWTGKPIVYLYHPYEFTPEVAGARSYERNVRVHGLRFRRYLIRGDSESKMDWNFKLWEYMYSFPATKFMSASQFAKWHHENES